MSRIFRLRKIWLFLGPIAALLLVLTGIFTSRIPLKAHAAPVVTLYVGQTIGTNSSCASPGFTSIQTAVDVANPGDIIYLCGTTPYAEQVIITKALTLTGDPGASIVAPGPFPSTSLTRLPPQFTTDNLFVPQAIVIIWGASANVKISNLIIAGVMPGNGGCAENEFGVLVIDGGTTTLVGDKVNDIRDTNASLYGCQFGVAIQIGREYWPTADFSAYKTENFVGHATIKNTSVSGYQKNGITVDGPGTTANLFTDTVNGAGQTDTTLSPFNGQNGIQISRGANNVQVQGTTVTGNAYTGGGGASATGILVYGGNCYESATPLTTGTKILHNTLQNNDIGVALSNLNGNSNNQCVLPITPTNIKANSNHITNIAVTNVSGYNLFNYPGGYQAGISDEGYGDQMDYNQICGVGYTPVSPPPYLSMIDVAATNPTLSGNTTCTITPIANVSTSMKAGKKGHHIRNVSNPYK